MRSGKAEWMRDIPDELLVQTAQDHEHLALLRKLGMASYVCVPLRARKGVVGALSLVSGEADRRYDESDVAFAQQVADRIALAIDNARLFRETQEAKVAAERLYEAEQKARAEAAAAEARQAGLVRELERAVRFSDMFVGILGHDLRNPLSGITTAASLVLSRADSERVTKPLSRILSSADRMSRMIDQVLDFTRIRLGRGIPLQQQAVDLAELCRNVVDELKSEGERGTAFRLEVRGDTRGVWDEDRLAQLVSNLAGNAFQHRQHDAPVTVSVDGTAPDVVALTVHNLGGIPQEILPVIFEPLRSGEHRKRKGSSGLGLGLYISQQIVIAHGGVIRAESADDETRFMLALPRTPPSGGEQVFGSSGQKDASSE
jgi:signal transduction histidine kinase